MNKFTKAILLIVAAIIVVGCTRILIKVVNMLI